MKKNGRRKVTATVIIMMMLAAINLCACSINHPIDESMLPDLEQQIEEQAVQQQDPQSSGAATDNSEPLISESEARSLVINRIPGAADENIVAFGRDIDNGRWIYEGEVIYDGLEYDFEIDAQTGNILEWEIDD